MRRPSPTPEILDLVSQLAGDSARFAKSELALAKAELIDALRKRLIGVIISFVGFLFASVAVIILAEAAVQALSPAIGSQALSGAVVAGILCLFALGCGLIARSLLGKRRKPVGMIWKWISTVGARA